jgi:hypothetical protein
MIKSHHQLMWSFTKSFLLSLRRPVFIYLSSLAVTAQLFFAGVFYWVEVGPSPHIHTLFDAFYYTVTVMTGVGLGDISPATAAGRWVSIFMMLSGTVIFVCFTGTLAASILEIESEHLNRNKDDGTKS